MIVLYLHAGLLILANGTTTMNKPFISMVLTPAAIVIAANVFNVWKSRRWSNVIGLLAGLAVVALQWTYAYFSYPHYGEAALGAAIIMALGPWVYAGLNVATAAILFFRKR